ncbi:hypothetical protein V6N11_065198 [Hibiscus sabdariffa]|uniref:Uncharacterized protein n=1 Tax=Hibiscus sabdariffa TaxID=183260 RepID=A0ABR2QG91_9ROSI
MQKQPTIQEVKVMESFCEICGNHHDSSDCGQNPESSCYVGNCNKNVMSNTYNPTWKKHPNFSWQNQNNTMNPSTSNQQGYQSQPRQNQQLNQPRTDQFIQKTDAFMNRTKMRMQNQEAALKSLENQVAQISQALKTRPMGGFPSDTKLAKGATHEQCKAISTRSGKVLKTPTRATKGKTLPPTPKQQMIQITLPRQASPP